MAADRDNLLRDIENDSINNDQAMDSSPHERNSESDDSSILMDVNDIGTLRLDVAPEPKGIQSRKKTLFYENSDDAEEEELNVRKSDEQGQRRYKASFQTTPIRDKQRDRE